MAAYVELIIDQGTTFYNQITITDDITNNVVNIAPLNFVSQMRPSYYSDVAAEITCTIADASRGIVEMSMSAEETAAIKPGRYVFDIKSIDPAANIVSRIVEGTILITPQVTR